MDVFWTLPPVSRTITALAVVVSALGYSGMIDLMNYVFIKEYIITTQVVPQIWRLFTAFMITKPKFGILLDPYFLYQYGSGLETESSRFSQPGDFFVYTMFVGAVIVAIAGFFLNSYMFLQALSLAFAYTYAQDNPSRQVSFFIITFDAKYLPFSMLFLTFIIDGGDAALSQAAGLVAAHLYDFLTRIWPTFGGGRNYIFTPIMVKRWFGGRAGNVQARPYGTAQQGRQPADAGAARATGRSTGFGGQWDGRGPGRRLGEQ
ncbi:DER1-domain-containing protein [Lindgomyces ingoldianus]|uniref:DER1-domain-containing protein n=1 Tax=Lindgomyces ingoldianus TaxID=673940 RepID=A0ACB6R4A8_9PLEO|nr:DER1-domain-containing protein [Lindgomyces ingoldianus]KAF2474103.1 DER1-domain-containing protein [Lindgomyces ingoldianus]